MDAEEDADNFAAYSDLLEGLEDLPKPEAPSVPESLGWKQLCDERIILQQCQTESASLLEYS